MKKVQILTTVFERPEITLFHLEWMESFIEQCQRFKLAEVRPFYMLSKEDAHLESWINEMGKRGFSFGTTSTPALSTKAQSGMNCIRDIGFCFDYLMHLDSDEFLSLELMIMWKKKMESGVPWFGPKDQVFYIPGIQKFYLFTGYDRQPVVNGGTCVSRQVIEDMGWVLWTKGLSEGLNRNEYLHLINSGWTVEAEECGFRGSLEIKDETQNQIHPLSWYQEKGYELIEMGLGQEINQIETAHPYLKRF